jgi:kynurenine formamidase
VVRRRVGRARPRRLRPAPRRRHRDPAADRARRVDRGRTGYLSGWPDADFIAAHEQAGIDRDAALWLAERGVLAVGADTEALEVLPSTVAGNPHPVHIALLNERGIWIIEMVDCEELASDRVYEFCFVCLPLSIRGATGSMVRPVALV